MFSVPIIENLRDLWARDFCKRRCKRFDFFYPSNQPIIKAEGSREDLLAGIAVSHVRATDDSRAQNSCHAPNQGLQRGPRWYGWELAWMSSAPGSCSLPWPVLSATIWQRVRVCATEVEPWVCANLCLDSLPSPLPWMEEEVLKCRPEEIVLMSLIPWLCDCMAASVWCPAINYISCPHQGPVQAHSRAFLSVQAWVSSHGNWSAGRAEQGRDLVPSQCWSFASA